MICGATGSGGTTAGLIPGTRLLDINARIAAVNVCDDHDTFLETIGTICETTIATYGVDIPFKRERDIDIVDGYVGRGVCPVTPGRAFPGPGLYGQSFLRHDPGA